MSATEPHRTPAPSGPPAGGAELHVYVQVISGVEHFVQYTAEHAARLGLVKAAAAPKNKARTPANKDPGSAAGR